MSEKIKVSTRYGTRILAENVVVSNDTRLTQLNNNDLLVGASGCGKTGGYIIPNLQKIESESLIVCDTKNQLQRKFEKELKYKGYDVFTIDFVNPQKSYGYNPLLGIRRYSNGKINEKDVLTVARALSPMGQSEELIWDQSAASYIAFIISYCLEACQPRERNLITVSELCRKFAQPGGDRMFLEWIDTHLDSFAAKKYFEINANRVADRMFASITGFVNEVMEMFSFYEAKYIFARRRNIDLRRIGKEKTVVFINTSDTDSSLDRLLNLFYMQTIQVLCREADNNEDGRLQVPVRLLMDDFGASGKIEDFPRMISVIRSRDISVGLVVQSITQLEARYGYADAMTIINNCDHLILWSSQDKETVDFIASRACMTPEAIRSKPRDKILLMASGEKAKMVNKIVPYSTCFTLVDVNELEEIPFET